MPRARLTALIAGVLFVVALGATTAGALARYRPTQITTVPGGETTTLEPTTIAPTTTFAPTTTLAPTTTTEAETTTTTSTTTTTVAPAPVETSKSSSTPWGWIIAILVLVAIALIAVLVVLRRSANRDKTEWKDAAASALRDADLTRDMLAGEARPGATEETALLAAVRDAVDRVAGDFDQLAAGAPSDDLRRSAIGVAASLRGYFFALEAEQMLHNAPTTPTGEQLAAADATKRARAADLDASVGAIRAYVAPDPAGR